MTYILMVDDDRDFTAAVQIALGEDGHEVKIEYDPKSGLDSMAARRPDLLILDVMFPEDSSAGFELAREVRKIYKDIPVLMLTGVNQKFPYGFSEGDIDSHWLPVAEFMEKPIELDVLCDKVNKLLSQKDSDSNN